jgi:CBS-domain-containing membrane protein
MRYSIMVQLVAGVTVILLGSAVLFAWIQTRTEPVELQRDKVSSHSHDLRS